MCSTVLKNNTLFVRMRGLVIIAMVAVLTLTGCADDSIVSPDVTDGGAPVQDDFSAEERAIFAEVGVSAGKAGTRVSRAPVYTFADPFGRVVGRSFVIRQKDSVLMLLRSAGLTAGTAVTMWAVIFNAPEHCTDNECGEDDLANPAARVDIVYVDGKVIREIMPGAPWRDFYYFGRRRVGDVEGSIMPVLFGVPALGLEDAGRAEVHLVLRDHGPVIPGLEEEMIGTFAGGCTGFPEELGKSGPNTCEDVQFAVHLSTP